MLSVTFRLVLNSLTTVLPLVLMLTFCFPTIVFGHGNTAPAEKEPIKLILNDWTSQNILAHIAGLIFEELGEAVTYKVMGTDSQWREISESKAHVQVEVWEGTMKDQYERLMASNVIVDAGTYSATTREEWWYPGYVEKLCPGLPNWEALKECYGIFATPVSDPDGVYINGPWEKPDKERIEALGLNFQITQVKNGDELWGKLEGAYKQKKPILLFNWTPNYIESLYDGDFVDFPDYASECETLPEWGINKEKLYDCGNPKAGWLKKITSTEVPKKWPCAYGVLQNFNFTNSEISDLTKDVDYLKIPIKRVALTWFTKNKAIWAKWIPQKCQS